MPHRKSRCLAMVPGSIAAAVMLSWGGLVWAEDAFEDCGIIQKSLASPFVQGRTQLAILNLANKDGTRCNLIDFRIAEVETPIRKSEIDGVARSWWKENWGVYRCGQPVVYDVWFQEIGLGGVTFDVKPNKTRPLTFVTGEMAAEGPVTSEVDAGKGKTKQKMAAADTSVAKSPGPMKKEPKEPEPQATATDDEASAEGTAAADAAGAGSTSGDLEAELLAIAKAAVGAEGGRPEPTTGETDDARLEAIAKAAVSGQDADVGSVAAALPPDSTAVAKASAEAQKSMTKDEGAAEMPSSVALPPRRELKLEKPNMKGHDVCAVQRALIADGISVTVDGLYGPGMKNAVAKFQKTHGLKANGIVSDSTRQALAYETGGKK